MYKLNGAKFNEDTPFELNGMKYPCNWLRLTTREQQEAIGIYYEEDPAPVVVEPPVKVVPERTYEDYRRAEYPNIGDQLDAIWKQLNYDRLNGRELIQDCDDVLGDILSIKAKYPKPEPIVEEKGDDAIVA